MYIIQILFFQLCLDIYFTMYCSTGKHLCLPLVDLNRSKLHFICDFFCDTSNPALIFYSIITIMVPALRGGIDSMCFIKVFVIFQNVMIKKKKTGRKFQVSGVQIINLPTNLRNAEKITGLVIWFVLCNIAYVLKIFVFFQGPNLANWLIIVCELSCDTSYVFTADFSQDSTQAMKYLLYCKLNKVCN